MFLVSSPICRFCRQNTVFREQLDNFISCCLHTTWDWKHSSAEGVYSSSLIPEMLTLRAALKKIAIKESFFLLKDTENRRDQNSLSKEPSGLVICLYRLQIYIYIYFFFPETGLKYVFWGTIESVFKHSKQKQDHGFFWHVVLKVNYLHQCILFQV